MNNKEKSPHILNTSSQLLGLCFIVLTALKIQDKRQETIIDEITAIASILFMISSILSFLSIRDKTARGETFEAVADFIFLIGLIIMFLLTMLITFNISPD